MNRPSWSDPHSSSHQVFMLGLCVYALVALAAQALFTLDAQTRSVLQYADSAICVLFLADFFLCLYHAPNRWRYLYTWGWLDLASSIPTLDVARWGRAARVARIFRVLRGVRATKVVAGLILDRRAESTLLAASLTAILFVVVASVSILHFEAAPESNIRTAEDALWWALATITTVGYGDRYPVTTEGRFVAVVLMSAGVGLFGICSGLLAAWFLAPGANKRSDELAEIRAELARLRETLDQRNQQENR